MTKAPLKYMPQLDAMRAIAVLLVIVSHWFDHAHFLNRYLPNGILGVTLFFVLSGYLITNILLKSKAEIERGASLGAAYKSFYIRRSLRIFPIYYLLLLILLFIGSPIVEANVGWHFLYLSNFLFWIKGEFAGNLSHFWSLSVEEQFYIFWPSFIFFIPKKHLTSLFIGCILLATVFRISMFDPPNHMGRFLVPASLDSFCVGALVAYGQQFKTNWFFSLQKNFKVALLLVVGAFVGYSLLIPNLPIKVGELTFLSSYFLIISALFGLVIFKCSQGVTNPFLKRILENSTLIYIGKISYGMYLYHNFVPFFYGLPLPHFLETFSIYIAQLLRFACLLAISSISWYVVEKPILKLKNRFNYKEAVPYHSEDTVPLVAVVTHKEVNVAE